jgi:hypothetical protein
MNNVKTGLGVGEIYIPGVLVQRSRIMYKFNLREFNHTCSPK